MTNKKLSNKISKILMISLMVVFTTILAVIMVASVSALTDTTNPTILTVMPTNNMQDLSRNEQIKVVFSEDMNPSTINSDTFIVMRRTTPEIGSYRSIVVSGTVVYNEGRTATFTSDSPLSPGQIYGNVFTVTITTGAKDISGNSLLQDYVWSFTTGTELFNTGSTTSQQNQSDSNVTVPVTVPTTVETPSLPTPTVQTPILSAPAVTPVTTTSNFSWIWAAVGGLFLLLLVVLISLRFVNTTPQKNSRVTRLNPFGDVHPVMAIEGIGPEYSKRLNTMGIKNTKQLWGADAAIVARKTGASLSAVKSWQNMSELASVKDIGPQYAELIERSGVHNITQLQESNPDKLLKAVREKQESLKVNIQGNSPGHATVEHWIIEARDHQFTKADEGLTA